MTLLNVFFDHQGRARSGWRFAVFLMLAVYTYLVFRVVISALLLLLSDNSNGGSNGDGAATSWLAVWLTDNTQILTHVLATFAAAMLVGWSCGRIFEGLPARALGLWVHRGWWRDLLFGSLVGALSLLLAAGLCALPGGLRFALIAPSLLPLAVNTLVMAALFFILAGAAEEALFRGYPLQTMLRAWPVWAALLPSALLFGLLHLGNPNVIGGFTFINTALAGIWLSISYLRTRSLWFPLGVHWSWNWMQGALLGLPVSGLTNLASQPLLRPVDAGPVWLTGGAYGIEGGAACTLALLVSSIFLLRTKLVNATSEMKQLTSIESNNHSPLQTTPLLRFNRTANSTETKSAAEPASDG